MHPCDSQRNSILATLEFATATGSQPSCRTAPWKNSETSETDLRTDIPSALGGQFPHFTLCARSFVSDFREKTLQKKDPAMNVWMVCGLGKKERACWVKRQEQALLLLLLQYCSWVLVRLAEDRQSHIWHHDRWAGAGLRRACVKSTYSILFPIHFTPSSVILRMCKKSTSQIRGESSFGRAAPYATH